MSKELLPQVDKIPALVDSQGPPPHATIVANGVHFIVSCACYDEQHPRMQHRVVTPDLGATNNNNNTKPTIMDSANANHPPTTTKSQASTATMASLFPTTTPKEDSYTFVPSTSHAPDKISAFSDEQIAQILSQPRPSRTKKPAPQPPFAAAATTKTTKTATPEKKRKRSNTEMNLKVICNAAVVATLPVSKNYAQSTSMGTLRWPTTQSKLDYKRLLAEYEHLVEHGTCQRVKFGETLHSAKRAIHHALSTMAASLPAEEDVHVLEEQREFRKSLRQIRRFEDQEKLSVQNDRMESYEKAMRLAQVAPRTDKRKRKEIQAEQRAFCQEPIRFSKAGRIIERHVCECLHPWSCALCQTIDFTPACVYSDIPRMRRINFFDLQDEGDDDDDDDEAADDDEKRPSDASLLVLENSSIALNSLLHSLEFIQEEMKH